jgi:hypothetical protein
MKMKKKEWNGNWKRKRKMEEEGGQMPVAHTYNLIFSGGRDQEDHSSKPAWTNSF